MPPDIKETELRSSYLVASPSANKNTSRASQIECTVITVMCTQTALHVQKNLCTLSIPLCRNNLNLLCSSFFCCPVLGCLVSLIVLSCLLPLCAALFLFVWLFFIENDFAAQPKTRYLLVNLKTGFYSSYFTDRKNIIGSFRWVYANRFYQMDFKIVSTYVFVENLSQFDVS